MSLLEVIRSDMTAAMKGGPDLAVKKNILRQVISEAQRLNVSGDEDVCRIARKLIGGNNENMTMGGAKPQLQEENTILTHYLPRTLHIEEVRLSLLTVAEGIKAAKNSGQATGVAMKHLKNLGSAVNSKDVALVIEDIRGVLGGNLSPAS